MADLGEQQTRAGELDGRAELCGRLHIGADRHAIEHGRNAERQKEVSAEERSAGELDHQVSVQGAAERSRIATNSIERRNSGHNPVAEAKL